MSFVLFWIERNLFKIVGIQKKVKDVYKVSWE